MTTLKDLGIAYRKAKVDLYYSSVPSLTKIVEYEDDLHKNLEKLLERINSPDSAWIEDEMFLGGWTLAPKSVDIQSQEITGDGIIYSSPKEEWDYVCRSLGECDPPRKPVAEFRVMADCSLDFHVLSTLWILKVGYLFDGRLQGCAFGNRLRRPKDGTGLNKLSHGSFKPYLAPFRDWRDQGIQTACNALKEGKRVVALTADVSSFYHELNPDFLLDKYFLDEVLKLELSEQQKRIHELFVTGLKAWAKRTPLKKGLPVGLPASAVVANVALIEFDRIIKSQCVPLYYGRYVDDVLLVMENGANFKSSQEVWEWIFARSNKLLSWYPKTRKNSQSRNLTNQIAFTPSYLKGCKLHFSNSKNKVFLLSGEPGLALVESVAQQIRERASEWRAMPNLPESAELVGTDLLSATQNDGEAADNLRKADLLTMRRASFAIKLRDFEAYDRTHDPEDWKEHRRAFFRAFVQHVLSLPYFFDLAQYLPRVIQLATGSEDWNALGKIIGGLENICQEVERSCDHSIKACSEKDLKNVHQSISFLFRRKLVNSVNESISSAFPRDLSRESKLQFTRKVAAALIKLNQDHTTIKLDHFENQNILLFNCDLAKLPFRVLALPAEMVSKRGIPKEKEVSIQNKAEEILPDQILSGANILADWCGFKGLPRGLLFATRPFNLPELYLLNEEAFNPGQPHQMNTVVLATRGFSIADSIPFLDQNKILNIPNRNLSPKCGIAVSSWETSMKYWNASVMQMPVSQIERYQRFCRLLNGVISQPKNCRYLVLPELSIPAKWFFLAAKKLHARGISLIAGVEYLHSEDLKVRNQAWASFAHDGLGYSDLMIYRQDKQMPALHEEQLLYQLAGVTLSPKVKWSTPPIIDHGGLRLAILICSELTNISYRAALRGKIDVLFVPEWNQDTETFNSLVESAALDIHAYIVQCNNRNYGDSRIRAPYKDSWKRDILRVKGGITDYCVIGEIDVESLRKFQSSHRSPPTAFKPVPDGFEMDIDRKVLP